MKIKADEKKKKEPRMSELEHQKLMLQRMMEQEKAERDLHYKQKYGERERGEGQGGFQRQQTGEARSVRPQPPGGPPAETLDCSHDLFEPEDDNKLTAPLLQTIERYNLIMSFMERTCKTPQEKQLCSILLTKMIP